MPKSTVQQIDDRELVAAIRKAGGRLKVAAELLGAQRTALSEALRAGGYAHRLWPVVEEARRQAGYDFGRPATVTVDPELLLSAWEQSGRRLFACAKLLEIDKFVCWRLLVDHGVPGAPAPRKR